LNRHGRLEIELPMLTLAESPFALAALERLPADPRAGELLRTLLRTASSLVPTASPPSAGGIRSRKNFNRRFSASSIQT